MFTKKIQFGTRVAIISANEPTGPFHTRLYVNDGETATGTCKTTKTLKWALIHARAMVQPS